MDSDGLVHWRRVVDALDASLDRIEVECENPSRNLIKYEIKRE